MAGIAGARFDSRATRASRRSRSIRIASCCSIVNYTNNSWTAEPRAAEASQKWALRWLTWVQELLLTYAAFA